MGTLLEEITAIGDTELQKVEQKRAEEAEKMLHSVRAAFIEAGISKEATEAITKLPYEIAPGVSITKVTSYPGYKLEVLYTCSECGKNRRVEIYTHTSGATMLRALWEVILAVQNGDTSQIRTDVGISMYCWECTCDDNHSSDSLESCIRQIVREELDNTNL